jgi:hypothetical protein
MVRFYKQQNNWKTAGRKRTSMECSGNAREKGDETTLLRWRRDWPYIERKIHEYEQRA